MLSEYVDDINRILKFGSIKSRKYYKYLSDTSKYLTNYFKGDVSFATPSEMNDIFDCAFEQSINNKKTIAKTDTRVLCLSKEKNIESMWGLYANRFNGFCFEYNLDDIIKSLSTKNEIRLLHFIMMLFRRKMTK